MKTLTEKKRDRAQNLLTKLIAERFCDGADLKPAGFHGSGRPFPREFVWTDIWADMKICDAVWWAVAYHMEDSRADVLDHSWYIKHRTRPDEIWALVGEPYTDAETAEKIAKDVNKRLGGWGVTVTALSESVSSWNPGGRCFPIIATLDKYGWEDLLKASFRWMAEHPHYVR